MDRSARSGARGRGPRPRPRADRALDRDGARARRVPAVLRQHGVHQHDPDGAPGAPAGRSGDRASHPLVRALERDGDGAAREQAHQRRRPHRELRVRRDAVRHRLQPLLARSHGDARRRPRVLPGTLGDRRIRARVHARPPDGAAARRVPAGSRRPRHLVVSASVAHARFLAVPDGVDGPRSVDGDLPGALHEVPRGSRARGNRGTQGLGVHGRRRDGRARVDGRDRHGVAREPRQPRSSSSTATCSASTGPCAATARSSRSSRATSAAPAGT